MARNALQSAWTWDMRSAAQSSLNAARTDSMRTRPTCLMQAVRDRGQSGGRPRKPVDPMQLELGPTRYANGQTNVATICRTISISRATLYRALKVDPA